MRLKSLLIPSLTPNRRRGLTVGVAATGALLSLAALAAPASASTASKGYILVNSNTAGPTPLGFSVYLSPTAPNRAAMEPRVKSAVSALAHYGVKISYRGRATHAVTDGVIMVTEDNATCKKDSTGTRLGLTAPVFLTLANGQVAIAGAHVSLCPWLYKYGAAEQQAITLHEMGHAMGLNHLNTKYAGKYQLMRYVYTSGITSYQSGDVNGLRAINAGAAKVRSLVYPKAHMDSVKRSSSTTVLFTGWSFLSGKSTQPVYYALYDNGKLLGYLDNRVTRADVNKAYHLTGAHGLSWNLASDKNAHTYCLHSTVSANYKEYTNLGCFKVAAVK